MNQKSDARTRAKDLENGKTPALNIPPGTLHLKDETKEEAARLVAAIAACSIRQHEARCRDKVMWQGGKALVIAEHRWLYPMVSASMPSDADHQRRVRVLKWLSDLVAGGVWRGRGLTVQPYGSFVSGLYTPSGDLDIGLEGFAMVGADGERVVLSGLDSRDRQRLFHRLADKLQSSPRIAKMERILHAKVPILRWLDVKEDIPVDLAISQSDSAQLKSIAMGLMSHFDPRASALVRLVKLWARAHGMNSPPDGTFNSYALSLMVVFHLQTRSPPILPTFREVFGGTENDMVPKTPKDLAVARDNLAYQLQNHRDRWSNSESLCQLLASFFALYHGIMVAWCGGGDPCLARILKNVCIDTWNGKLTYKVWAKSEYRGSIEDPFEREENCARTLRVDKDPNRVVVAVSKGLEAFDILFGSLKAREPKSKSNDELAAEFHAVLFGQDGIRGFRDANTKGSSNSRLPVPQRPFIPRSIQSVIGEKLESDVLMTPQRAKKFQPDFKAKDVSFTLEQSQPSTSQEKQLAERILNGERPFEACTGLDCAKFRIPEDPNVKLKVRLEQIEEAMNSLMTAPSCWVAVREDSLMIARQLATQYAAEEARQKASKEERRKRRSANRKEKEHGAGEKDGGKEKGEGTGEKKKPSGSAVIGNDKQSRKKSKGRRGGGHKGASNPKGEVGPGLDSNKGQGRRTRGGGGAPRTSDTRRTPPTNFKEGTYNSH
jgi:DNA polymerase sigma